MYLPYVQHMRISGSGTASPRDIDLAWEELQAAALRDLILKHNARPDGRGLLDQRSLECEVMSESPSFSENPWRSSKDYCVWFVAPEPAASEDRDVKQNVTSHYPLLEVRYSIQAYCQHMSVSNFLALKLAKAVRAKHVSADSL